MDVVADGLDAAAAGRRLAEQVPRDVGQPIGLAVSAAEEEHERLFGKIFHRMLVLRQCDRVGLARVVQQRSRRKPQPALRRTDACAPVAEAIPVGRHGNGRVRHHPVGNDDVVGARVMDVQHQHHRRRLRTVVDQLVTNTDLHGRRRFARRGEGTHVSLFIAGKPVGPVGEADEGRKRCANRGRITTRQDESSLTACACYQETATTIVRERKTLFQPPRSLILDNQNSHRRLCPIVGHSRSFNRFLTRISGSFQ